MPIYQTNIWICERCGATDSETMEADFYSDPVVSPPGNRNWDYHKIDGEHLLCCPVCCQGMVEL